VKLAADQNAEVRHSVYSQASALRRTDPEMFALVLMQLCELEADPYLLETWGPLHLLRGAPTEGERAVWDLACVELLQRCFGRGKTPIPSKVVASDQFGSIVADLAVHMALTGAPGSLDATRAAIRTPAGEGTVFPLGYCIAERLIQELDAGARRPAAVTLLREYGARAAAAVRLDPSTLGPELLAATQIAEVLGAALLGEKAMPWAAPIKTHQEDTSSSSISVGVRACIQEVRGIWRAAVDPWLQSDFLPGLQRMLQQSLRVARALLRECPQEAAVIVVNWRLGEFASRLEGAVKSEITSVLRDSLTREENALTSDQQRDLMLLLAALVKAGHQEARSLAQHLSDRLRNGA
jgi:hypothetical protein